MLVLSQKNTVSRPGKVIVLHPVFIGDDHQQGATIAGICKGAVDMVGNVIINITGVGPEHADAIRSVPGKVIVVRPDAVAMVHGYSIILKLHGVIKNVCSPALVHHNASTESRCIISPYIDPA
jgi:hypothetical protein